MLVSLLKLLLEGIVLHLRYLAYETVYSPFMSCKDVGFFILHQRSFVCDHFKCFFHLWGHGGPDWEQEFKRWQLECQQEWILVSPSKARAKLGLLAMKKPPAKSSPKTSLGAKKKLRFATFINYEACKGYHYPASSQDCLTIREAGYVVNSDE